MFCFKMNETALKRKHNLKKASFSVHRTRRAFTVRVAKRREEEKKVLINTFITGRFMLFTLDGKLKWKTNCLLSAQDRRFMISTFPDVVDFIWLWMLFIRTKKKSIFISYSLLPWQRKMFCAWFFSFLHVIDVIIVFLCHKKAQLKYIMLWFVYRYLFSFYVSLFE